MTAFFDLFVGNSSRPDPFTDPSWADRQFPPLVASSSFHLWRPGDPIAERGIRLLIGVATWSGYDMRLLDVLAEAMSRRPTPDSPVLEVFNTADCRQPRDFTSYVPKLGMVHHTPVVGIWRDGELEWSGQGYEARDRAARLFGSGSAEIVEYVQDWIKTRSSAR
jgi:hypothetical protein